MKTCLNLDSASDSKASETPMIDVSDVQGLAQKNSPKHLEYGVRGEQHSFLQQTILFQLATECQQTDDVPGGLTVVLLGALLHPE